MKEKNNWQKLKALKNAEKNQHQAEVQSVLQKTNNDKMIKLYQYKVNKKLSWQHYFYIVIITLALIGISFLIAILAWHDLKKAEWMIASMIIIIMLIWLILGWYKNKQAANYFNDARRRYDSTLTNEEAILKKIRKICLLISCLLLISSLIIYFTT